MRKFKIITDSCCDLPISYIEKYSIPFVSLTYHYNDIERIDDFGESYSFKNFYKDLRDGYVPKTSQPSTQSFYDAFKNILDEDSDILYIGASSGLSGTVNSANLAKNMIIEDYPNSKIIIIDILTACLGQGLVVLKALEMQSQGSSMDEIASYLEGIKQNINTFMIVNDINYLRKGGRISTTAAVAGMLLNIKPFLSISNEGKVLALDKFRGRKKAINALFEKVLERIKNPEEQVIAVSHGDCIEDAIQLKTLILEKIKVKDVLMSYIGPVVGSFGGPGAMAVFFLGNERESQIEQ